MKSKVAQPSTFLKHIQKLANHITYDIASDILFEIVHPFVQTKEKPLVSQALNVIICFLKDIRIQKDFFNHETINHIENLICDREYCRICCDLLRIGIETGSFLGQDVTEQENIYQKLMDLQINSSFQILQSIDSFKARKIDDKDELVNCFHNASIFWFYNLELYKRIPSFREQFEKKCEILETATPQQLLLTNVIHKLLECFFKCNPSKADSIDDTHKASLRVTMTLANERNVGVKKLDVSVGLEELSSTSFNEICQFYYQDLDNDSWYLNSLLNKSDSVPIFDINQQIEAAPVEDLQNHHLVAGASINHPSDKETFFGKIINLFSYYLWNGAGENSRVHGGKVNDKANTDSALVITDVVERRECKKYLLKIIESALSILFRFKGETECDGKFFLLLFLFIFEIGCVKKLCVLYKFYSTIFLKVDLPSSSLVTFRLSSGEFQSCTSILP